MSALMLLVVLLLLLVAVLALVLVCGEVDGGLSSLAGELEAVVVVGVVADGRDCSKVEEEGRRYSCVRERMMLRS